MQIKLDTIILFVKDVDQLKLFYVGILKFDVIRGKLVLEIKKEA